MATLSFHKLKLMLAPACAIALIGCAKAEGTVLGQEPGSSAPAQVRELKPAATVLIQGVMTEKCPVAGCWFMLRDSSGVIRVDTKAAGFTVTDVPVNSAVTVVGTMKQDGEKVFSAKGLRY